MAFNSKKIDQTIGLGCGDGSVTLAFKEKLDVKKVFQWVSRRRFSGKAPWDQSPLSKPDKDRLPFSDDSFDLAISLEVIEHLHNPDKMLKEARRVLKKRVVARLNTQFG